MINECKGLKTLLALSFRISTTKDLLQIMMEMFKPIVLLETIDIEVRFKVTLSIKVVRLPLGSLVGNKTSHNCFQAVEMSKFLI